MLFHAGYPRYLLIVLICLFFGPAELSAGPYIDSAHGDSTIGVNRQATSTKGYARGNCGHCHEQHSSLDGGEPVPVSGSPSGYLLLANGFNDAATANPYNQTDSVCFYCHATTGSLQTGGIVNNNFSATFAGATAESVSIQDAFNKASYHNLYDVKQFITGVSGSKSFADFPAGSTPCSGCHNIHIAKANRTAPGNPVLTAISKPSDHSNLFGDDSPAERMSDLIYNNNYQPPIYFSVTQLEPDGLSSDRAIQADKTPDYAEFCSDCHNATNLIYSTTLGRNLRTIDWDSEKHGKANAEGSLSVDSPYITGTGSMGYVLSCTDCHEPHGSSNAFLIRKDVNGATLAGTIVSTSNWNYLCDRCHDDDHEAIHHSSTDWAYTARQCSQCHPGGTNPINCADCHYHGSWVNDPSNPLDKTPDNDPPTRVTF